MTVEKNEKNYFDIRNEEIKEKEESEDEEEEYEENETHKIRNWILGILFFIVGFFGIAMIEALFLMLLFNFIANYFGFMNITYWIALAITLFITLIIIIIGDPLKIILKYSKEKTEKYLYDDEDYEEDPDEDPDDDEKEDQEEN